MPVPDFLAVVSANVAIRTRASAAANVIIPVKPYGVAGFISRLYKCGGVR